MFRLVFTLALTLLCAGLAAQEYRFVSAKNGKDVTLEKLAAKLQKYDFVFFGEWHGNAAIHQAENALLAALYARDPRLMVSFEMFERDVQSNLDVYLKGDIEEAEFLAAARPWPNYATDYRPLVDFAKEHGLVCVAANVPRYLAGKAARSGAGFEETLSEEERTFLALQVSAPPGAYRDNFLLTMQANGMHGDADNADLYERLYYAQCVKDDTMAESILQYRDRWPKQRIIHFNGDFHSREFLGTVERVKARQPKLKIAVISPLSVDEKLPASPEKIATYFVVIAAADEE